GSAVTDGEVVCAFFGSRGLYCYDMDGNPLWDRDFGDMRIRMGFGEGASPALHGDAIVVVWDHEGQSFITALDKRTGAQRWRTDRDESTSWSTPLVVEHAGGTQVVTSATDGVRGYDLETGALLWEGEGVTTNAIPSPVAAGGIAYLMSGYRGNRLYAVDLASARGDISRGGGIVWSLDRDTPYVPSPVVHDGILYFTKSNSGILSAYDAATGENLYGPVRLSGIRDVYASPVVAGGRLYVTSRDGVTLVARAGPEFEILSMNRLDDDFDASPAVVGGEIYLRGRQYLYCIAAD
ncbi:MAG: PQQ-binding-like beta-propeller repeat protein, partial [Acidobacteriota bacterium]|nr:PQQ-binding-like beta-propeller repeat protein [Acidobacteriota bacterium]